MHENFAQWYRAICVEPKADILPKRWSAVEKHPISRNAIAALIRLFYKHGEPGEEFLSQFRAIFQTEDLTFPMSNNDQELRLLAGAVLVNTIKGSTGDNAYMAAIGLITTAIQNLGPTPPIPNIPEIAVRYVNEKVSHRDSEPTNGEGEDAEARFGSLSAKLQLVTEETNMLWWLFSEYSRDLMSPWKTVGLPAATVIAGKELADLTRVIPGPIGAAAFLDRILRCAKAKPPVKSKLKDSVNAVAISWRQKFVSETFVRDLEDLIPLSKAISMSVAAPANDGWLPSFTQSSCISSDAEAAPASIAYQMYLEGLLSKLWKGST